MKGENLWNKPTPEQAQILSLAAMLQGGNKSLNSSGKKSGKKKSEKSDETSESTKKKDRGIKSWMLVAPKNGKPKTMTKNDKEYHWCHKYSNGAGQWICHRPADHSDDFKSKKKSSNSGGSSDDSLKKKKGKKNSSASDGGSAANSAGSGNGGDSLQFNRSTLMSIAAGNNSDTQAFLSQFIPGND